MEETSVKGLCPQCGHADLVLRTFEREEDKTGFQYCSNCQWAEEV